MTYHRHWTVIERLSSLLSSKQTNCPSRIGSYWMVSSFLITIFFLYYLLLAYWDHKLLFHQSQVKYYRVFLYVHYFHLINKYSRLLWLSIHVRVCTTENYHSLLDEIFPHDRFWIRTWADAFCAMQSQQRRHYLSDDDGSRLVDRKRRHHLPRSRYEGKRVAPTRMEASNMLKLPVFSKITSTGRWLIDGIPTSSISIPTVESNASIHRHPVLISLNWMGQLLKRLPPFRSQWIWS